MLLTTVQPSDAHRAFLAQKAGSITAAVFKVFWPSAKGSLHHACCVLDCLLRSYADAVSPALKELRVKFMVVPDRVTESCGGFVAYLMCSVAWEPVS